MTRIKSILASALACSILTISTSGAQNFILRNYYGAKLEPGTKVLHGAGQSSWNKSVQEYRQTLQGKYDPVIINEYAGAMTTASGADNFVNNMKTWLAQFPNYTVLQIGLALGGSEKDGLPFKDFTQAVASGAYDSNLNYFFSALNSLNVPIYLRIGFECNGSWNSYATDSYKRAYARVVSLLRSTALNNNAASVWCIAADGSARYMDWYPGDQFVDWWSIDLYPPGTLSSTVTKSYLSDAHGHRKPVMIGEASASYTGVSGGQKSWDAWFKPYFELIRNNPGIKAFNYINWNWTLYSSQWPGWLDARIGQNGIITGLYAQEMALPLYLHASTKQAFWDSLKPPGPKGFAIR